MLKYKIEGSIPSITANQTRHIMTTKIKLHEIAFNKLYFYNLMERRIARKKYTSVVEAELTEISLKRIVDKLTPEELDYLTERIDAISI